jgi:hypothetical protein
MKVIARFLLISLLMGCNSQDCEVDEIFRKTFNEMTGIVKKDYRSQEGLPNRSVRAIFYLEGISGIKSTAVIGDLSYYETSKDFKSDLKNWKEWFKINRCEISREKSEEVLLRVIDKTKWMDESN